MPAKRKTTKKSKASVRVTGKGAYKRNFVRGRGDFFSDAVGGVASSLDKLLGGVPRSLANRAGRFITGKGTYKSNFVRGRGDYSTAAKLAPPSVPMFGTAGRHNYLTYREYLGDVYSSVDFAVTTFNLNAGLGDPTSDIPQCRGAFPWLAPQAANRYEQYKLRGCIFQFISTSSDAIVSGSTNAALGQVVLATEYNTNRQDYTNLSDALNSQYATAQKPSINFTHLIECEPKEKSQDVHYIRSGPVPTGSDILQYDTCKTMLITQGMPADGQVIGQLWITYKVELYKPIFIDQADSVLEYAGQWTYDNASTTVSNGAVFGSNASNFKPVEGTNIAMSYSPLANAIYFPPGVPAGGVFQCTLAVFGSATALVDSWQNPSYASFPSGPCRFLNTWDNQSVNTLAQAAGASDAKSTMQFQTIYVQTTDTTTNATGIAFGPATFPTSVTWVDFTLVQVNPQVAQMLLDKDYRNRAIKFRQQKGNFWRPRKSAPTAPWLKGKDRTKEHRPKSFIQDSKDDDADSADDSGDEESHGPLSRRGEEDLLTALLIRRQRRRQIDEESDTSLVSAKAALGRIRGANSASEAGDRKEEMPPTKPVLVEASTSSGPPASSARAGSSRLKEEEEYVRVPKSMVKTS